MAAAAPSACSLELDDIIVNDMPFVFPRYLRPIVGVDSAVGGWYFEAPAMLGLVAAVNPGDTVYDVGMSWGVVTCVLSRLVGEDGRVHAFEANPQVVTGAREFIAANGFAPRVTLTLACAGDVTGHPAKFHIVPGANSVASTRNRDIQAFHTDAWPVLIPTVSLDYYSALDGKPPSCIKIDVEGSEYLVLRGAERLLGTHQPILVLETHGKEIDGIGGSVAEVCDLLADIDYDFYDLAAAAAADPKEFAAAHEEKIGYLLASPRSARDRITARLTEAKALMREPYRFPAPEPLPAPVE